ncbi:MAG: HlyD family efflux transporter periplasmic adaptor subunit [Bacteroidales bacterium]|jgi:HlyD family secretion protein
MKKVFLFTLPVYLLISSCNRDKDNPDAYGTFEATEVTVSSQANGRLLFLNVEEGQVIDSNILVGIVDTLDLAIRKSVTRDQQLATAARRDDLAAQIAVQEQNKTNILVEKARIERLLKDGAATTKQLDDINANLKLADKQIASIKSQYASLDAQVSTFNKQIDQINNSIVDAHIINPIKGTVLTKYAEPTEITTFGKPVYKIADLTSLDLRVYVSGAQLPYIKIGQKVKVHYDKDENTNSTAEGFVTWISETAEFTPKTIQTKEERVNLVYAAKVRTKNDGTLKIGMPGDIRFMPSK